MMLVDFMYSPNYLEMANTAGTLVRVDTLDASIDEFSRLYVDKEPYVKVPMMGGDCYQWSEEFINNCLIAFATDKMTQFNEQELEAFYIFTNFQNYHSTSAKETDANGTAIGCTIPNSANESYVVGEDGEIFDGTNGSAKQFCQPPTYDVGEEDAWKSLDNVFMALYNCEEINDCNNTDSMENIPCELN